MRKIKDFRAFVNESATWTKEKWSTQELRLAVENARAIGKWLRGETDVFDAQYEIRDNQEAWGDEMDRGEKHEFDGYVERLADPKTRQRSINYLTDIDIDNYPEDDPEMDKAMDIVASELKA